MKQSFYHDPLEILSPAAPKLNRRNVTRMLIIQVGAIEDGPMVEASQVSDLPGCDIFFLINTMFVGVEEEIQLILYSG